MFLKTNKLELLKAKRKIKRAKIGKSLRIVHKIQEISAISVMCRAYREIRNNCFFYLNLKTNLFFTVISLLKRFYEQIVFALLLAVVWTK